MARVPADWVVPLPQGLTLFEAMALGTAGYTAALAIHLLEHNGMAPGNGKVVVNGATGGCASLAIDMLARLGLQRDRAHRQNGRARLPEGHRRQRSAGPGGLDGGNAGRWKRRLWAAAFDSVGGEQLAALTRTMQQHGTHRELRQRRRHRAAHHGVAVHPARGTPDRHRFGLYADGDPAQGMAASCDRSEAAASRRTSRKPSRWISCRKYSRKCSRQQSRGRIVVITGGVSASACCNGRAKARRSTR